MLIFHTLKKKSNGCKGSNSTSEVVEYRTSSIVSQLSRLGMELNHDFLAMSKKGLHLYLHQQFFPPRRWKGMGEKRKVYARPQFLNTPIPINNISMSLDSLFLVNKHVAGPSSYY